MAVVAGPEMCQGISRDHREGVNNHIQEGEVSTLDKARIHSLEKIQRLMQIRRTNEWTTKEWGIGKMVQQSLDLYELLWRTKKLDNFLLKQISVATPPLKKIIYVNDEKKR